MQHLTTATSVRETYLSDGTLVLQISIKLPSKVLPVEHLKDNSNSFSSEDNSETETEDDGEVETEDEEGSQAFEEPSIAPLVYTYPLPWYQRWICMRF